MDLPSSKPSLFRSILGADGAATATGNVEGSGRSCCSSLDTTDTETSDAAGAVADCTEDGPVFLAVADSRSRGRYSVVRVVCPVPRMDIIGYNHQQRELEFLQTFECSLVW